MLNITYLDEHRSKDKNKKNLKTPTTGTAEVIIFNGQSVKENNTQSIPLENIHDKFLSKYFPKQTIRSIRDSGSEGWYLVLENDGQTARLECIRKS